MAGREEPYDPYIPSGSAPSAGRAGDHGGTPKTAAIQAVCELIMVDAVWFGSNFERRCCLSYHMEVEIWLVPGSLSQNTQPRSYSQLMRTFLTSDQSKSTDASSLLVRKSS